MLSEIQSNLNNAKISLVQLDPFGFCNSKCYFCPVKYHGNPRREMVQMDKLVLEKVLDELDDERGKIVSGSFDLVYTSHYNEVILYKGFRTLLSLLRSHGMKTIILTNGVALDADKRRTILEYKEAVYGICFNVPSCEAGEWGSFTGFDAGRFSDLQSNIGGCESLRIAGLDISLQVNDKLPGRGQGTIEKYREKFEWLNVFGNFGLSDRASLLREHGISNELQIPLEGEVYDCSNARRHYEWLHVNAKGEAFLCCNDYFMQHKFGDFNKESLEDFWGGEKHMRVIEESLSGICRKCVHGIRR